MTKPEESTTGVASDSAKMKTSCSFCLFGIFRVLILPRTENVMSPFNSINTILQDKMHAFRFINSTWQTVHPPVNSLPSISLCLKRQWMTKKSAKVNTTKFVRQILLIHYSLSQRIFRIHQACLNNLQNSPNPSNSPCFFTIFLSLSFCVLWKVCNAWGHHVDWRAEAAPKAWLACTFQSVPSHTNPQTVPSCTKTKQIFSTMWIWYQILWDKR